MYKRNIQYILILIIVLLQSNEGLRATHNVGIDIRLECLNACSIRVNFKAYRDCTGAYDVTTDPSWVSADPNCTQAPTRVLSFAVVKTEVTPVCPLVTTYCSDPNATIHGVEQHAWNIIYNTCNASPCVYDLFYMDCCRNMPITSLVNPGGLQMSVHLRGIDLTAPTCNNSPQYHNIPVLHLCTGQSRTYDMGGTDPDGDSLSYAIATCMADSMVPVPFQVGYSTTSPLGPTWGCSIDSSTGLLRMTAQPGSPQIGVVCVTTSEFRNGNLIATNTRDMQIVVLQCNGNNTPPAVTSIALANGNASVIGNHVYTCIQNPFCLDIIAADANPGQVFSYFWSASIPGATFSDANNPNITDTLWSYFGNAAIGRFCWTPSNAGTYGLRLSMVDNFCPVPSGGDTVIWIHVVPMPFAQAAVTPLACLDYGFAGGAGGCGTSGNFSYLWSGGGGLSSTSQNFNHHFPYPGIYPWQLIVDDGQGYRDTIRDTIVAAQSLTWSQIMTGNTLLDACLGPTGCILDAGPGFSNYSWSTGATTQTITVYNPGAYSVTVEETTGCRLRDIENVVKTPADLSGIVTSHLGVPMALQKVRLLRIQSAPLAFVTIDSTLTDASGYYQFCNITDTTVYAKVHPDINAFPLDMPTYADSALVWNLANGASPLLNGPTVRDIHAIYGQNPGGSGSLGGTVVQGTNKVGGIGDPVPGLRLFLRHVGLGQIVGYRDTDVNGYFVFSGLPIADYEVIPDFPYVDENLPPFVALNAQLTQRNQLDFILHPTWLELVTTIGFVDHGRTSFSFEAWPNPCTGPLTLEMELEQASKLSFAFYDLAGRQLTTPQTQRFSAGHHQQILEIGALAKGVYCLRVWVNGQVHVLRIVKA
ncbi:MAG: T9SS type A sorting domain-containing protein [Bacteroidetes bacterium]|nr:T9SS type A sorting domain-containing protein [Bacteroidota bacterium]